MATARPFAYNTSGTIDGTTQVGDISVGVPTSGFTNSPQYWNGPDEELGYVIAFPVSGNTQPTPIIVSAPTKLLTLSTTYIGWDINLSNGNQTATQQFGYQQTVLGNAQIDPSSKIMFSVLFNTSTPSTLPGSHVIGIGRTSMKYKGIGGNDSAYPGIDVESMGYCADGTILFNGGVYAGGLATWTENDVIDIVINNNIGGMWVRVNGGDWNNNPTDNPETNAGGIEIINSPFYPALCPAYEGVMTIQNSAEYGVPTGYTLLGSNETASVSFFRSADLTDNSFVELANGLFNQSFTGASEAGTWLTNNGYWNSYEGVPSSTPTNTPTGTNEPTSTPTPTPTNTPTGTNEPTPTPSTTPTNTPTGTNEPTPTPTPTPTSGATGPFSVSFVESGSDILMSYSGTLDLTGLDFVQNTTSGSGGVGAAQGAFGIGPSGALDISLYTGATFSYPSNFGTGGGGPSSVTGTGDYFGVFSGILPTNCLVVPSGYTSGDYIIGTTTLSGSSFTSLGMNTGDYDYSWGAGEGQSFVLTIGGVGPTPTPTATSVTPTPTPTSGYTGDGWLFYSPEGPVSVGPPDNNGNSIFVIQSGTISTYNPNYTGATLQIYFNSGTTLGTSYLTQFQGLDISGGTLTASQGSNAVIYSGNSSEYVVSPSGFLQLTLNRTEQMVQSASTPFVSGTTINVVVS
jgi:hypothetical protein